MFRENDNRSKHCSAIVTIIIGIAMGPITIEEKFERDKNGGNDTREITQRDYRRVLLLQIGAWQQEQRPWQERRL